MTVCVNLLGYFYFYIIFFPASFWILSLIPFPLSFSINGYVFVCTCFMPLKKVRIGSKAKAIYPIHYKYIYIYIFFFQQKAGRTPMEGIQHPQPEPL